MVHVATRVCSKMHIPQSRPCMFSVGNVGSGSLRNAATASSYALGIFVNNWAAGYLTSAVVQIIIQDMR